MEEKVQYILSLKDLFSPQIDAADRKASHLDSTMSTLKSTMMELAAVAGGAYLAKEIVDVTAKMQALTNVINYTSGSTQEAAQNNAFLTDIIHKLKLPIMETMEGFSQLNAAMIGSKLQGQGMRDVFEGVSIASTALHLSADKTGAVFYALNNMMSVGTVMAQDLKLQLGNALPGALHLAAEAMGVTQQKFVKMMSEGKIISEDFLPKFAKKLKEEFGGAIPNAVESLQSKMTDLKNNFIELEVELGDDFMPVTLEVMGVMKDFMQLVHDSIGFVKEHQAAIKGISATLATLLAGILLWNTYLKINVWWNGLSTAAIILNTLATEGFSAALVALSIAIESVPVIGWIIAITAALTGLFVYLFNKFDTFRAYMMGIWEVIKVIGQAFYGLGQMIGGVFSMSPAKIVEGLTTMKDALSHLGDAYSKGYSASIQVDAVKQSDDAKKKFMSEDAKDIFNTTKNIKNSTQGTDLGTPKVANQRPTNIYITIQKMIDKFDINVTNMTEGKDKVKQYVAQALLEAVNDAQIINGH